MAEHVWATITNWQEWVRIAAVILGWETGRFIIRHLRWQR